MKQLKPSFEKLQISCRKTLKSNSRSNAYSRQQPLPKSNSRLRLRTQHTKPITLSLLRNTQPSLIKTKSKNPSLTKIVRKNPHNSSSSLISSKNPSRSHSHFVSVNQESNLNSHFSTKPLTRVDSTKPSRNNREQLRKIIDSIKQRQTRKPKGQQDKKQKSMISRSINLKRKSSSKSILHHQPKIQLPKPIQIKYAYRSEEGILASNPLKTNQDSLLIKTKFTNQNCSLFAVADGHGLSGHHVSKFAVKNLSKLLETALKTLDPVQSLKISYKKVQQMLEESEINAEYSGTTLITILIRENDLYCANVGDSRAIVISSINPPNSNNSFSQNPITSSYKNHSWQISQLSRDHKPTIPTQKQRILKHGGRIEPFHDQNGDPIGPMRVWLANQNVQGLAMSRSIGDNISKSIGVTYQPEIISYKLKEKDKIIVMGSDGLWEFINNQQAASVILPYYLKGKLEDGIDALVSLAYKRWTREDDSVVDDITVIVVFLEK